MNIASVLTFGKSAEYAVNLFELQMLKRDFMYTFDFNNHSIQSSYIYIKCLAVCLMLSTLFCSDLYLSSSYTNRKLFVHQVYMLLISPCFFILMTLPNGVSFIIIDEWTLKNDYYLWQIYCVLHKTESRHYGYADRLESKFPLVLGSTINLQLTTNDINTVKLMS